MSFIKVIIENLCHFMQKLNKQIKSFNTPLIGR